MEKLKPKLFSVMKTYTKEQFVKDVIAGIIVAIIALPSGIITAAYMDEINKQKSKFELQFLVQRIINN